jgi:hypothetical protein
MLSRPFEKIDRTDLETLVSNAVSERRDLEFKRDLPGDAPKDVHEFLADVTSLANAQGGDLIFGMEARDGVAKALVGLSVPSEDKTLQRLENMLRDSVDPRLAGVRMEWIPLEAGRGAVLIRVPASLAAPHRISFHKSGLFYGRNSRGKYPMDAHELRVAFTQSEQLPQKIRQLHDDAVAAVGGRNMPFALDDEPAAIVSTVPVGFFREARDLPITHENVQVPVAVSGGIGWIHALEGVLMHTPLNDVGRVRSYALTHWAGRVDVAWTIGGPRDIRGQEYRLVFPQRFERGLLDAAGSAAARLRQHGVEGPWVVLTTIVGVDGCQMVLNEMQLSKAAWRDTATIGALVVDHINESSLMPTLNAFWLLFGLQRPAGRTI